MGEYGGESNAKKRARMDLWSAALGRPGSSVNASVHNKRVLLLSGPDGWDVQVACAFGADPRNVVAVDLDADRIDSARDRQRRFAGVEWVHGSAFDLLHARAFDVAFLDFCATTNSIKGPAAAALAACVGRLRDEQNACGSRDAPMLKAVVAVMYGRDGIHSDGNGSAENPRLNALHRELGAGCFAEGALWSPQDALSYHSRRAEKQGVPMVAATGSVQPLRVNNRKERRRLAKNMLTEKRKGRCEPVQLWRGKHDADGDKLRRTAVAVARAHSVAFAAQALCVPESTVRAWLAHDTRGTYNSDH